MTGFGRVTVTVKVNIATNSGQIAYDTTVIDPEDASYTVGETYQRQSARIAFSGTTVTASNCKVLQVTGYMY